MNLLNLQDTYHVVGGVALQITTQKEEDVNKINDIAVKDFQDPHDFQYFLDRLTANGVNTNELKFKFTKV